jgi:hypothetical protein
MLDFGGSIYYIDLDALDKAITLTKYDKNKQNVESETKQVFDDTGKLILVEKYEKTYNQNKEIDAAKYDFLKTFIEIIVDFETDADDALGADRALSQTPLGYKIVFNTLYKEGIIKEKR